MDADDMGPALKEVLISADQIGTRVGELAARIDADYAGRDLLLVGVLKGAVMMMADLARAMHLPVQMDWMAVSSYGSGTRSSGVVRILKDLDTDISGRHVLVVEDIIDSGLTLSWLVGNLESRDPASVAVCTMLRKPSSTQMDVEVAYTGFEVPDEFVVGYGLDYGERYRNLPFIGTLAPETYRGPGTLTRAEEADVPWRVAPGQRRSTPSSLWVLWETQRGEHFWRRVALTVGVSGVVLPAAPPVAGVPSDIHCARPGTAAGTEQAWQCRRWSAGREAGQEGTAPSLRGRSQWS